jgi:pyruvate formate lyase activating enzyme
MMFRFLYYPRLEKVRCKICNKISEYISKSIGICADCVRTKNPDVLKIARTVHIEARKQYNLPGEPPRGSGVKCNLCVNRCDISIGEKGYCGLRTNSNGKLQHLGGTPAKGILEWYYDNLPTNCVAAEFCPGCSGSGYPKYAYRKGPEYGYKNLAVFYEACSFDCLFCQNWQYRYGPKRLHAVSAEQLASNVDEYTSCICYFGGDPTPQIMHAIKTSEIAVEYATKNNKILRICWETNGSMNTNFLKKIAELSLKTGGCVKFDLKTWTDEMNIVLCGVTNKQTLKNFEILANYCKERRNPPFLIASTLLIPEYVNVYEVKQISKFIAGLDAEIPYNLLAFYPHFYMNDLPRTSRTFAENCYMTAKKAGLKNVRIGNIHLLV